jgi:hypothetical protein
MSLSLTIVIVLTIMTLTFGPDWPGRAWVRLGVYVLLFLAMWRMLLTLLVVQNRNGLSRKRKKRKVDDAVG